MRKDIRRICISLALLAVIGCSYFLWSGPVSHEENMPFSGADYANIRSVMDFGEVIRVHLMEVRKDISDISAAKAYLLDKYEVIKGIMGPIQDRCQALLKNATVYFCAVYSDETPERWKEKLANWWEAYLFPNE